MRDELENPMVISYRRTYRPFTREWAREIIENYSTAETELRFLLEKAEETYGSRLEAMQEIVRTLRKNCVSIDADENTATAEDMEREIRSMIYEVLPMLKYDFWQGDMIYAEWLAREESY